MIKSVSDLTNIIYFHSFIHLISNIRMIQWQIGKCELLNWENKNVNKNNYYFRRQMWEIVHEITYSDVLHSIRFQIFFVQAFKIIVNTWKFSTLLLYILGDDRPNFMISGSNEQLQQQLEYTLLKPDCHRWGISKMPSDTLEEGYGIKLYFKLEKKKMPQKHMEWWEVWEE